MTTKSLPPAIWERSLIALAAITVGLLLSSCAHMNPLEPEPEPQAPVAEKKPPPEPVRPPEPSRLYEWYGSDAYVSHIEISINEQKARFYSGDKEVGWTTVASGVYKRPTPVGSFAVLEKVPNKKSNLYGRIYNKHGKLVKRNADMGVDSVPEGGRFEGASMPYFLRLTNDGIGMHAGPIPRPGHRASHGCIRMPKKFAPVLYRYVDVGTPVTIKGKGPTYARYLATQRRSAPRPGPTVVAQAEPAAGTDATPATVKPENSEGTAPVRASEEVVAATQPTEAADSLPATAEEAALVPTLVGISDDSQSATAAPSADTADAAGPTSAAGGDSSLLSAPAAALIVVPSVLDAAVSDSPSSTPAGGSEPVPPPTSDSSSPVGVPSKQPVSQSLEGTTDAPLSSERSGEHQSLPVKPVPAPAAAEAAARGEG